VDQNKNIDLRSGVFTNNDISASIKLAITNTGSFQILLPGDSSMLNFSGSTPLFVATISGSASLSYTLVSMN
jgi:hypothetical protein